MLNNDSMDKLQSERLKYFPNVNSLLKISLGLILFTIISTAVVYAETISVDVDGTSYDIQYTATTMTVSGVEPDLDFVSLIITVDVPDSTGTLDVTFERSFFDSTYKGTDDDFIVLADADEATFTETDTNSQSRTLSIELPAGTQDVEIIGSVFGGSATETPEVSPETPEVPTPEETTQIPPEETPEVPTLIEEKPTTQCGPGTILEGGECVLDDRCGPGTTLKNDVCVLDSVPQSTKSGIGKGLFVGAIAAFVIAGVVGVILGIVAKTSKTKP